MLDEKINPPLTQKWVKKNSIFQNEKKKNDASARDKKKDNFELDLDKIVKPKSTTPGKPAEQPLVPVTSNNTVSMQKV